MKYKGIIFDLDGVLCSTDRFHFEAWKQTAEEVGAPFDETINMKLRGVSRMESLEIILSFPAAARPLPMRKRNALPPRKTTAIASCWRRCRPPICPLPCATP